MIQLLLIKLHSVLSDREPKISPLTLAMLDMWLVFISFYPTSSISRGTLDIFHGLPVNLVRFAFIFVCVASTFSLFTRDINLKRWSALLNVALFSWMSFSFVVRNPFTVGAGTCAGMALTAFIVFLKISVLQKETR